jgi:hypothetical protein
MSTLSFDRVEDLLFNAWAAGNVETTFCLLGPPGIGKTSLGEAVVSRMTEHTQARHPGAAPGVLEVIDLTSKNPEDMSGLPFRQKGRNGLDETVHAPLAWLNRLCNPDVYGAMILDDIPAATPAVQVASRQLVLERRVGDARLSPNILPVVTGNRREDKSGASVLPAHFRNAVCILELQPDLEGWCGWYGRQADHEPLIASFLRFRPAHHSKLPKDADERGAFATPRSWAKLGRLYAVAEKSKSLFQVASGLVGSGPATELLAFVNTRAQLVEPGLVLDDPLKHLPNPKVLDTPDKCYAMSTGLGEVAAARLRGPKSKVAAGTPLAFLRAVGHSTSSAREYIAVAVSTFIANGGSVQLLADAMRKSGKDPIIDEMRAFLNKALNKTN